MSEAAKQARARKSTPGKNTSSVTPMMAQYLAIKVEHDDALLFYRMGDFYELFFDDAVAAAEALDITLTHRGKHEGAEIPMCGVPVHAADGYLAQLIRKGFRVAVCEQTENPAEAKKRGPKSVVNREVVRLVTPGTLTEDALLDARAANHLAALARAEGHYALAWCDMSAGKFVVTSVSARAIDAELARIDAGEILVSEGLLGEESLFEVFAEWKDALASQPAALFDSQAAERRLCDVFRVESLEAFGSFSRAEISAAGAIVEYVRLTQKGQIPRLAPPVRLETGQTMSIDAATRRNLELTESLSGDRRASLIGMIDRTVTGAGARELAGRLAAPLTSSTDIGDRLDGVTFFFESTDARDALRDHLRQVPDLSRALGRITVGRASPRDLGAIRDGLAKVPAIRDALARATNELAGMPRDIKTLSQGLGEHITLVERFRRALVESPPMLIRDGGFIARGYHEALDELVTLRDDGRRLVTELGERYRRETGIASLKVKHNNVLGYFVDVTAAHADKLGEDFIHRQTLASAMRFTTTELGELEQRINTAAGKALALEMTLFEDLVAEAVLRADDIARAADALAGLDVAAGLAALAAERRYTRPAVDDTLAFAITGGRHPVVEALATGSADFVPNDCNLFEDQRLWLLTGPNMAGKSTFLRQNALIAILAQIGSYVPAEHAHIGVIDRLFSRVGAADDLARGRSTFMVEMIETAAILNQAGERALVILDEIGRGTATFDGLSIAWATVEHLHEVNRCRALFATHYHELTTLAANLSSLACHTMRVKEWQGDVVFLHEVTAGAADRSYGIHVARLAGLPAPVVGRATEVLEQLERDNKGGAVSRLADDLPLFSASGSPGPAGANVAAPDLLRETLAAVSPDELSPRDALSLIYRLRAMAED